MNSSGRISNQSGFTLIELLIVIGIIGILASLALPQFTKYKERAYNTQVISDLHKIFAACKAYWSDYTGSDLCSIAVLTSTGYGYVPDSNITINITTGTESGFGANGNHTDSPTTYTIDSNGNIL